MRVKKATVSAVIFVVGTPLIVDPLFKSANSPYQGSTQQKNCFFLEIFRKQVDPTPPRYI